MSPLARDILAQLEGGALQFHDIVDAHMDARWPDFLRAWGELRDADLLRRDDDGAYIIANDDG